MASKNMFALTDFRGVNYREENLAQSVSPGADNVDTSRGLVAKRKGYSQLFGSLGAYPTRGVVTHLDSLAYFEGNGSIYRASGTALESVDDFSAGTKDVVQLVDGDLYLFPPNGQKPNFLEYNDVPYSGGEWSSIVSKSVDGVVINTRGFVGVDGYDIQSSKNVDFTNIDEIVFDYVTVDTSQQSGFYVCQIIIGGTTVWNISGSDDLTVVGETVNCSSLTGELSVTIRAKGDEGSGDDVGGVNWTVTNFRFNYPTTITGQEGYYEKVFDLTAAPVFAKLVFDTSALVGGSISASYKTSADNDSYSGTKYATSGQDIDLARYVKVTVDFSYTNQYPIDLIFLDSLKISYSLSYTPVSIQTSQDGKLRGIGVGNFVYMTAGEQPFKDDGTLASVLGIAAPPEAPTLSDSSVAGLPTGIYKGIFTLVNVDGVESDGSLVSTQVTVSSEKITWTVPVGGTDCVARRLYRTIAGGSVYYLVTEIEDNTTTTYTDNNTDLEIQNSSNIAPDANTNLVPPDSTIIAEHGNHLWFVPSSNEKRLYFSRVFGSDSSAPYAAFEQVPTDYYYEFPHSITGIKSFAGHLIVTGNYFTTIIVGTIFGGTLDNTIIKKIDNMGAVTHEAMALAEGTNGKLLAMMTKHGISYLTTGQYETDLGRAPLSQPISPKLKDAVLTDAFLFYFRDFLYAGFTNSSGIRVIYRFDFFRSTWDGPWDIPLFSMEEFNKGIIGADNEVVQLHTMFNADTDNGTNIAMVYNLRFASSGENVTLGKSYIVANNDTVPTSLAIALQGDSDIRAWNIGSGWSEPNVSLIGMQKEMLRALGSLNMQGDRFGVQLSDASENSITIKKIVISYQQKGG